MKESREKVIKAITHYQQNLERYLAKHEDAKMLHCINRLQGLPITVSHLEETGVGRTVNSLRKINGEVGDAARILVNKWKGMVEQDGDDDMDTNKDSSNDKQNTEKDKHTSSHYSDKHKSSSKNKSRENDEKKKEKEKRRDNEYKNKKMDETKQVDDNEYRLKMEREIKKEVLELGDEKQTSSKRKNRFGSSDDESRIENRLKSNKEIKEEIVSSSYEHRKDNYRLKEIKEELSFSDDNAKEDTNFQLESLIEPKKEKDDIEQNDDESDEEIIHDNLYRVKSEKEIKKEVLSRSDTSKIDKCRQKGETDLKRVTSSKRKHESTSSDEDKNRLQKIRKETDSYDKKHKSQHKNDNKLQTKHDESDNDDEFHNYSDGNESTTESYKGGHTALQSSSHRAKHATDDLEEHSSHKSSKNRHSGVSESDTEERVEKKKHKHKKHDKHDKHDKHSTDKIKTKVLPQSEGESEDEKKKTKKSKHKDKSKSKDGESKHTKSDSKKHSDKHKDKKDKNRSEKLSDNSKHESKSSSKSNGDKKNESKSSSSIKTVSVQDGIDSGSGASFAEALGMLVPSTSISKTPSNKVSTKKKSVTTPEKSSYSAAEKSPYTTPEKKSKSNEHSLVVPLPSTLTNPMKLEPLDINISSLLPPISTNYRPLGNNLIEAQCSRANKALYDTEALSRLMYAKNARTKVYSGNKTLYNTVPSLFELCTRILQVNIDALEYTGGVPYSILKPVLDKATPDQLFTLEHHNPYIIEESDELWDIHCKKEFRNKRREELETSREMYMRCLDEREAKLKALTANIKLSQDKSIPIRQTKLAFVDSVVKPPRNIAKKQARNGIEKKPVITPSSRLSAIATSGAAGQISVPCPARASSSSSTSNSSFNKVKKAPLMQKTLQLMKGRFRR